MANNQLDAFRIYCKNARYKIWNSNATINLKLIKQTD